MKSRTSKSRTPLIMPIMCMAAVDLLAANIGGSLPPQYTYLLAEP